MDVTEKGQDNPRRPSLSQLLTIGIALFICIGPEYYFHFVLGIDYVHIHLFYIPIALAAIWWGLKSGLLVSLFLAFLHIGLHSFDIDISVLSMSLGFILMGSMVGVVSDGRKRAERELHKKKEVEAIFLGSGDGMRTIDTEFKITNQNEEMGRFCGVKKTEAVGKKCSKICPSSLCNTDKCPLRQILSGANRVEIETEITSVKGKNTPVSIVTTAFKDDEGRVIGVIESFRDITERKRAEEEIKQKTEDLLLINSLNNAVNQGKNLQEILILLSSETKKVFSSYGATVYFLSEDKKYLVLQKHLLLSPIVNRVEKISGIKIPGAEIKISLKEGSLYQRVLQENEPQLINDSETIRGLIAELTQSKVVKELIPKIYKVLGIKSVMIAPFVSGSEVIGLMSISKGEPFAESDLKRLKVLSEQVTSILEHKRAEEKTKLAYKELSQIFNTAADGMRLVDKDFNILKVNETFSSLVGISKDEAVGKKCYEVFHGPLCDTLDCPLSRILGGEERVECEVEKERRDGTKVPYIMVATPFRALDGKLIGVVEDFKDITERKQFEENLRRKVLELTTLSKISTDIGSTLELDKVLNLSLESALKLLDAECGSIMLLDEKKELLTVAAASCLSKEFIKAKEKLGEGIAGHVAKTAEPLLLKKDMKDTRFEKYKKKRKIKDALSVPIRTKDKIIGTFNVDNKEQGTFTPNDLKLFTILASEVGAAIENARLYGDIRQGLLNTVEALAIAVDAKDPYTQGHSERVTEYSLAIAKEMGLPKNKIEEVEIAARLHDVGKIGVSEKILGKPGKLTDKEWKIIKAHPVTSAKILEPVDFPSSIISSVLSHHERLDGKGYPNGLSKDKIPLGASIIKVADAYDAMTSDRPYRKALSEEKAISELKKHEGTQFHPDVVEVFLKVHERKVKGQKSS